MMEARSLEELSNQFDSKLSRLTGALAIDASLHDSDEDVRTESQRSLEMVWQELEELSVILTLMRTHLTEHRQTLGGVQEVKKKLITLVEGLQHASSNLPPRLPPVHHPPQSMQPAVNGTRIEMEPDLKPAQLPSTVSETPCPLRPAMKPTPLPQARSSPCPLLEYITVDEFENVPKYMKGRLGYQRVNAFIDEVNKAFKAKYKLLRQKKSTLSDASRKRYETFKMQETKDTAGAYFVTENDLKEWSSIKLSKENRSVLTILRHCGRMYEIRSGGLLRYAVVDSY